MFSDKLADLGELPVKFSAEAVKLGRDMDVPLILKRAFYELARAPLPVQSQTDKRDPDNKAEEWEEESEKGEPQEDDEDEEQREQAEDEEQGKQAEDEEQGEQAEDDEESHSEDEPHNPILSLDPTDLLLLSNLQKNLLSKWAHIMSNMLTDPRCPRQIRRTATGKFCNPRFLWSLTHDPTEGLGPWQLDPLHALHQMELMDWKEMGFCHICAMSKGTWLASHRKLIWSDMDLWLEL